jgi:plastocyanin
MHMLNFSRLSFLATVFALCLTIACGDLDDDDIICDPEFDGPDCVCDDEEDLDTCEFIDEDGDETPQEVTVDIIDFGFSPQNIEVAQGGSVTWTNKEATQHSVTCDECGFDEVLDENGSFSFTFNQTGTFNYLDRLNTGPKLSGTITVR